MHSEAFPKAEVLGKPPAFYFNCEHFPKPGWFSEMLLKKRSKARFFP
jgi:hypothetical protein